MRLAVCESLALTLQQQQQKLALTVISERRDMTEIRFRSFRANVGPTLSFFAITCYLLQANIIKVIKYLIILFKRRRFEADC